MPWRISPFWPSLFIRFIIVAMSSNCFSSRLTSGTVVPEPAAMRFLRLALMIVGLAPFLGRHRADDRGLALDQASCRGWPSSICCLILPHARQHAQDAAQAAHLARSAGAGWRSRRGRTALRHLARRASRPRPGRSVSAAFSTRPTTSPMPRMRPATRSGWKSSSASSFSPVPMNLIGAPVTARIDSAAPPRASPSMRVSTMPVTPTRSSNALGGVDRVLAGHGIDHQQGLGRAWSRRAPPRPRPSAPRRYGGGRRCRG